MVNLFTFESFLASSPLRTLTQQHARHEFSHAAIEIGTDNFIYVGVLKTTPSKPALSEMKGYNDDSSPSKRAASDA